MDGLRSEEAEGWGGGGVCQTRMTKTTWCPLLPYARDAKFADAFIAPYLSSPDECRKYCFFKRRKRLVKMSFEGFDFLLQGHTDFLTMFSFTILSTVVTK